MLEMTFAIVEIELTYPIHPPTVEVRITGVDWEDIKRQRNNFFDQYMLNPVYNKDKWTIRPIIPYYSISQMRE